MHLPCYDRQFLKTCRNVSLSFDRTSLCVCVSVCVCVGACRLYEVECYTVCTVSVSHTEGKVGSFLVRLSSVDKSERHYSLSVK